jgi:signal transduction histidine kinase
MKPPTLLGQLLRIQTGVVVASCLLLACGAMGASAILLRKDQDGDLRSLATSLCRTLEAEEREPGGDQRQAALEAFGQMTMTDHRFELRDSRGTVLVSEGELPGFSSARIELLRNRNCRTDFPGGAWLGGPAYRACMRVCDRRRSIVVAAGDTLVRIEVRRAAIGLLAVLPLAALSGALLGRSWLRRRLRPLAELERAAGRLETSHGMVLGVGAAPSELASLERAFDSLLGRLEEALARERRFTQEASHELRTSLTVLRGRTEVLRRGVESDARLRQEAEAALAELASLDRLVEALLLLARSESAGLPSVPVNLCDLAREAAGRQARTDGPGGPPVDVEAPDEILVRGSEELLARALGNLVENARKFAGAGARIRIRATRGAGLGILLVEDDGPGIPADLRPFVFERFFRGPADRRRGVPGTGLGLAVVRTIVRRHGGEVSTGPSDLGGEAVRFSLPLLEEGGIEARAV